MVDEPPRVVELSTERLRLRALTLADAPGLHLAYADAQAMRFWDSLPSCDLADTEARISRSLSWGSEWQAA